jgi:AMMECR1 domain-containing protein
MKKRNARAFLFRSNSKQAARCIGTISAVTGSVAEEIQRNAVSACSQDPLSTP